MSNAPAPPSHVSSPLVITGGDAEARLRAHPGIHVGHFPIPALFRKFGHTATAEVTESGVVAVTELVGLWRHLFQEIEVHRPTPFYGEFSAYRWVQVGNTELLAAYRLAVTEAMTAYHNRLYTASSNRFVSTVLRKTGVELTPAVIAALGPAPGIRWRYRF